MFRPLKQIWERFETDKADSDGAAFSCLLLIGEMIVKVTVAGLVAAVGDDRERSRYQQSYRLVRADGIGEWVEVLDEILVGPSAQTLAPEARVEARELTQKVGLESWQYEAVSLLHECLRMIDSSTADLPTKVDLRRWFRDFAQLRNQTRGHGAQRSYLLSRVCPKLERSLKLVGASFSLFKREWTYLHRNLSGKYRVTELTASGHTFDHLKSTTSATYANGIYLALGEAKLVRVDLVRSTPDGDDFHLPNGNFNDKRFEMLSYISGEKLLEDASPYLEPPGPLPKSETQGLGLLDVEDSCFGNLPPKPAAYVSRASLEAELEGLLSDDYHPIVTPHGMGGIGKTSLALTVLHSIAESKRFSVALWFSARDIDLLQEGPRRVQPHILDVEDVAEEYARLIVPPQASEKSFKASAFLAGQLTRSEIGPTPFVFDNFETVTNPGEFFKWVETYTRSPNKGKCCNFENGDGGRPERSWAARFQAARSNSWSMN